MTLSKVEAAKELTELRQNLADFQYLADRERRYLTELETKIRGAIVTVPYLEQDVHDLAGLELVAAHLVGADSDTAPAGRKALRSNEVNGGNS